MAKFTNDLSFELSLIQHEEILAAINDKYRRQSKELSIKMGIFTGAMISSAHIAVTQDKPFLVIGTGAVLALSHSLYNLYIQNKHLKPYKIDNNNPQSIDFRALAKEQRERDRYNGKLTHTAPYRYELEEKEEIEEEFGHESDNDLPIQFLEQELVPARIIREYELYSKRYETPELKLSQVDIEEFVTRFSELLKKVHLSHRIYYYTSNYFKRLISKGIINYWDEITLDTLLNNLYIFEGIDLTKEDIQEFINNYPKEEKTKKLK